MLVAIDKAIRRLGQARRGPRTAVPHRLRQDVTAFVEFVAPSLTTHPLRFDGNVRQLQPLPTIGQIDLIAPSVDESNYTIQNSTLCSTASCPPSGVTASSSS
jgi:hypothetical protein